MTYRIEIDRSLCSGFGACAELAPRPFEIGPGRNRRRSASARATIRRGSGGGRLPHGRDHRHRGERRHERRRHRRCGPGRISLCRTPAVERLFRTDPARRRGAARPLPQAGPFEGAAGGSGGPRRRPATPHRLVGRSPDRAHARAPRRADQTRLQDGAASRGRRAPLGCPRRRNGLARPEASRGPPRPRRPHAPLLSGCPGLAP